MSLSQVGAVTYDPFRDRVLFPGSLVSGPPHLWASDAAGNLTDLGIANASVSGLTLGAGGRIYARSAIAGMPLVYRLGPLGRRDLHARALGDRGRSRTRPARRARAAAAANRALD